MVSTLFIQSLTSVVSVGLGCGTCCSPYISLYLSSYTMTHAKSIKKSFRIFLDFFLGKLIAIILLCSLTFFIGKKWISDKGYVGKFNLHLLIEIAFLLIGIALILKFIYQKTNKKSCKNCSGNCNALQSTKWPTIAVGFFYGITPCAPMMLLAGYALMLSFWQCLVMALVFSIMSSFSPMLITIFVAGFLSQKMYEEIPKWVEWIQLLCYIMFVIMALVMIFIK